ncbi:hypothetical protein CTAYLR_006489 [Chrysophaeum taylorii]|uniref:SGNH hydrolase-type esterase domain-containing protein n=1 Tax=Chrysophaeum taylorii TaxID=2483200 RepID=A0AAD7XT74_9STRA|nr:hypothetical protein CTAYLR_006489 [Chrysophaeum taylorii]
MTRLWAASSSLLCVPILLGTRIGATVVACVGDSITERGFPSYPELLEGELSASLHAYVQVGNFGKGGKTALTTNKDSYVRETEYSEALQSNADVFVVQLGTNDAKLSLWDEGSFRADLRYLVAQFATLAQAPMVVLCAPPPYIEPEEDKWGPPEDNPINLVLADIIEEIANVSGYAFVDNFNLFLEVDNLQSYYADGIHPNQLVASLLNGTEEYTISNATADARTVYVATVVRLHFLADANPDANSNVVPNFVSTPDSSAVAHPDERALDPSDEPGAFSFCFEHAVAVDELSFSVVRAYYYDFDAIGFTVDISDRDHETAAFVLTVEAVLDSVPVSTVNVTRVRPYASIGRRRLDNSTYVNASAIDFTLRSNAPLDEISSILDTAIASGDFTDILHALANGTALDQATAISVTLCSYRRLGSRTSDAKRSKFDATAAAAI